ncbi:hypothetical protein B0J17DRAFT_669318 [Rhizoctonia solani]|nr:hypothetical protein B0J17DRAFT_669318 [Rhizoctonia solani]
MRAERGRQFAKAIDWILPLSIIAYAIWGLYMSVFHVGIGWIGCHKASPIYSIVHIIFSAIIVSLIIGLILFLWTLPLDHDTPPRIEHEIAQEWFDQYPRECFNSAGALSVCTRGQCNGRIKPPRTHHCSVCQRCRMDWDHHVSIQYDAVRFAKYLHILQVPMGRQLLDGSSK